MMPLFFGESLSRFADNLGFYSLRRSDGEISAAL